MKWYGPLVDHVWCTRWDGQFERVSIHSVTFRGGNKHTSPARLVIGWALPRREYVARSTFIPIMSVCMLGCMDRNDCYFAPTHAALTSRASHLSIATGVLVAEQRGQTAIDVASCSALRRSEQHGHVE